LSTSVPRCEPKIGLPLVEGHAHSAMADVFFASGFALDEYLVPRCEPTLPPRGGTMPKAANNAGGLFAQTAKQSDKLPGPGHYHKEVLDKSFVRDARGGTFSKVTRDKTHRGERSPSVGQYETSNAQITPRTLGGHMAKTDRKNVVTKMAERLAAWNFNGPGKYDPKFPEPNMRSPNFASSKTEPRREKKASSVGPGYYTPSYVHSDVSVPSYTTPKEEGGTFMSRVQNKKDKIPFPWYKDMPDSKVQDKLGKKVHCKQLLRDRDTPPRIYPPTAKSRMHGTSPRAASARAATSRAGTPRAATPRALTPRAATAPAGSRRPSRGTPFPTMAAIPPAQEDV
jgi:hypothetical protein